MKVSAVFVGSLWYRNGIAPDLASMPVVPAGTGRPASSTTMV
jgi:hypothetical protein